MAAFSQEAIPNSIPSNQPFQAFCLQEDPIGILGTKSSDNMSPAESTSSVNETVCRKKDTLGLKAMSSIIHAGVKDDKAINNCCSSVNCTDVSPNNESQVENVSLNAKDGCNAVSICQPKKSEEPIHQLGNVPKDGDTSSITVPFGWRRIISDGRIIYISPSECQLRSLQEVMVYLQSDGTCKCGLECPVIIDRVFNFNPSIFSKPWNVADFSWNDATKLCNHKRKIIAMATFQNSTNLQSTMTSSQDTPQSSVSRSEINHKKETGLTTKKKRGLKGKNRSPFDGVLVSQLLAQRDKLGLRRDKKDDIHSRVPSVSNHLSEAQGLSTVHTENTSLQTTTLSESTKQTLSEYNQENVLHSNVSESNNLTGQYEMVNTWGITDNDYKRSDSLGCTDSTMHNRTSQVTVQVTCSSVCGSQSNCLKQVLSTNSLSSVETESLQKNVDHNRLLYTKPTAALPNNNNNNTSHNIRPCLQQQPYSSPQSLFSSSNIVAGSINCISGNYSNQPSTGHIFSSQLQINQCLGLNGQLPCGMLSSLSQQICSASVPFRVDSSNVIPLTNTLFAGSNSINTTNSNITVSPQAGLQGVTVGNIPSPQASNICEVETVSSKQKMKKIVKNKVGKFGCMLDRTSPCPNVDVRQIPPEHHRPPPEAIAAITGVNSSLHSGQNSIPTLLSAGNNLNYQRNYTTDSHYTLNCPVTSNVVGLSTQPCRTEVENNFIDSISKTVETSQSTVNSTSFIHNANALSWPKSLSSTSIPIQDSITSSQQTKGQLFPYPNCATVMSKTNNTPVHSYNNIPLNVQMANNVQTTSNNPILNRNLSNYENQSVLSHTRNLSVSNAESMTLMNNSVCTNTNGNNYQIKSPTQECNKNSSSTSLLHTYSNPSGVPSHSSSMSSLILPVTSNNIIFTSSLNVPNSSGCPSVTSVNQNLLGFPVTSVATQTGQNATAPLPPASVMACFQQPRPGLTINAQQSVLYNGTTNPSASNHNNCGPTATNLFMPATSLSGIDGPTGSLRPSILQQSVSPGFLVQQVLSQKVSSDYPAGNVLSSAARAQVVQQVSGMVLPAPQSGASSSSQQVLLAPTQIRMPGNNNLSSLITMLPTGGTSGSVVTGTQVLASPAQQMVIQDSVRPNVVNPQQQLLQNNCFIMGPSQPTFVARHPQTLVGPSPGQVTCHTNMPLSVSGNGCGGILYNSHHDPTLVNSSSLVGSIYQKNHESNEVIQHVVNGSETQATIIGKEQNVNGNYQSDHSPSRRSIVQSVEESENGHCLWAGNQASGTNINTLNNQVTNGVLNHASTSAKGGSVPSNISGQTLLSSCGPVLLNDTTGHSQSLTVSNMTNVIPMMGGQCAINSPMPPLSVPNVTAVTTSMTQVIPAVGIAPQILGQPVQPVVQVINAVPFNSMQNAVLVSGGPNILSQTVRLDALQPAPMVGASPASNIFNSVILPPSSMTCVQTSQMAASVSVNSQQSALPVTNHNDDGRNATDIAAEARATPGSNSSCSTPLSTSSSTPVPVNDATQTILNQGNSPTSRKRNRDGKRKMTSQTVASMLQLGNQVSPVVVPGISGSGPQQQFLQQPLLHTVTVLPSLQGHQPRQVIHQQVVNYSSITPVGGHQLLTTGLASPLGIVQPLNMLGVTPSGTTVIQNIPVQQMMPGPPLQSVTVLQGPHTVNPIPQDQQPMVVNDPSALGVQPTHIHSAFDGGSLVPNLVAASPVIGTAVGGPEVLVNGTVQATQPVASVQRQAVSSQQFASVIPQIVPSTSQTATSTTNTRNVHITKLNVSGSCVGSHTRLMMNSVSCETPVTSLSSSDSVSDNADKDCKLAKPIEEVSLQARSIGVQSGEMEDNTVTQPSNVESAVHTTEQAVTNSVKENNPEQNLSVDNGQEKVSVDGNNKYFQSNVVCSNESVWSNPVNLSSAIEQEKCVAEVALISERETTVAIENQSEVSESSVQNAISSEENKTGRSLENSNEDVSDLPSALDLSTANPLIPLFEANKGIGLCNVEQIERNIEKEETACVDITEEWNSTALSELPSETTDNAAENASTASSDTSEQTSDGHVTSDSGVESSQEPMNLACNRGERNSVSLEMLDAIPETLVTEDISPPFEDVIDQEIEDVQKNRRKGVKRHWREMLVLSQEGSKEQESEDDTPSSPPLPPQPRTFNVGDLVWGQIRGFPSWPGKLVREDEVKGNHIKTEAGKRT
ncbi:uncharacterized protein [Centruroides vittatus]|uniref:uncharacterized protein isoform X2 n=1 Tax=Centruroides vittatus TaxID=120091 RepID=UPI00350ED2B2